MPLQEIAIEYPATALRKRISAVCILHVCSFDNVQNLGSYKTIITSVIVYNFSNVLVFP